VFWSKIWFFLIALAATAALALALALPRPAARAQATEEQRRLGVACDVVDILLTDDARNRVEVTGAFSRTDTVVAALETASSIDKLDDATMKKVRGVGEEVVKTIEGRKPDFAILLDRRGRVVANVNIDQDEYGDTLAGRPLVDDALAGYLRDDIWVFNNSMYFVAASPVIKRDATVEYVGAVLLGHKVTNELAQGLSGRVGVDVGFYLAGEPVAQSRSVSFDKATMQKAIGALSSGDPARDCQASKPTPVRAGKENITAIVARLPGEAATKQGYFTIFAAQPVDPGFLGTFKRLTKDDLTGDFPWVLVGGGFVLALAIGIGLMLVETDRPLRRLTADVVKLAKGETERLAEDAHPGKFGSIARSVNIHIDKLGREAKTAKKDLDQLLGPAPEGSLGTIDLLATALPSVRPGGAGPATPPPPSEFRFGDSGSSPARGTPVVPPAATAKTPPPVSFKNIGTQPGVGGGAAPVAAPPPPKPPLPPPPQTGPMAVQKAPPPLRLDDDILGGNAEPSTVGAAPTPPPPAGGYDPYFKEVYDQFIAMKQACNEQTSGLTFEKFADKLVRNRDDLKAKTGCTEVKFTVYVKDGKAALKATPV